jgi:hypothetical protein
MSNCRVWHPFYLFISTQNWPQRPTFSRTIRTKPYFHPQSSPTLVRTYTQPPHPPRTHPTVVAEPVLQPSPHPPRSRRRARRTPIAAGSERDDRVVCTTVAGVTPGFKGANPSVTHKCARIKSHTFDDSWYRNKCHIFNK